MNNIKRIIKKYFQTFAYFYRYLRFRLFIRMGLSIGVGFLDGFGLAMFLPLLQLVNNSSSISSKGLGNLSFIVNSMEKLGIHLTLFNVLIIMSTFFVLKGGVQYISSIYEITLRQLFISTIRIKLSHALSQMSYKNFVMSNAGRIQNTMSGEVGNVSNAYQFYFGAFQQVVMVIVYMLFAFFVDAKFALLICLGGGLTNIIYRKIYKATKEASKKLTLGANAYQGLIIQFVNNFKYLKATGSIKKYNKKLIDVIHYIQENNKKIGMLSAIVSATREPLLIIVVSLVILMQVELLHGLLSTILISLLFFYRALSSLVQMQSAYNNFLSVSGSMDNMTNFEKELNLAREKEGKQIIKNFTDSIQLYGASFKYAEKYILKNIHLTIKKNQTIAFVGESGSGKTSLVNVISGLLPLSEGKMYIDNIENTQLNVESFSKRIGYITQEPVIFNDTIFNNVSFWAEATEENKLRFQQAIEQAYINQFILELPLKENTMLGNSGVNLSGGQKQRISIARELFKKVDIIVMDEATSALDSETERYIQNSIENLHGTYTVIVIAHRLSTIKNVDKIYLLDDGKVVNQGSYEEMLINSPKFKKMIALQEV